MLQKNPQEVFQLVLYYKCAVPMKCFSLSCITNVQSPEMFQLVLYYKCAVPRKCFSLSCITNVQSPEMFQLVLYYKCAVPRKCFSLSCITNVQSPEMFQLVLYYKCAVPRKCFSLSCVTNVLSQEMFQLVLYYKCAIPRNVSACPVLQMCSPQEVFQLVPYYKCAIPRKCFSLSWITNEQSQAGLWSRKIFLDPDSDSSSFKKPTPAENIDSTDSDSTTLIPGSVSACPVLQICFSGPGQFLRPPQSGGAVRFWGVHRCGGEGGGHHHHRLLRPLQPQRRPQTPRFFQKRLADCRGWRLLTLYCLNSFFRCFGT